MLDTQQELFEHELRDIYDAEHKLVRALRTMAKKVPDRTLSEGLEDHRRITQGQIKRLEKIFRLLDRKPRREPCRGINGLIDEFKRFVDQEDVSDEILSAFAVGEGLKVEQYEIVAYEMLLKLATRLDLPDALELLGENLAEELDAVRQLEALAERLAGPAVLVASNMPDVASDVTERQIVLEEKPATVPIDYPL